MKPTTFEGQHLSYVGTHAFVLPSEGCMTCWKMTWRERIKALFTGCVWVAVEVGGMSLLRVQIDKPILLDSGKYSRRLRVPHSPALGDFPPYSDGG